MGRGGKREGAGRRSPWRHPKTVLIRVPEVFVDRVLAFARELDCQEERQREAEETSAAPSIAQLSLLAEEPAPIVSCPQCGSVEVLPARRLKNGRSRYRCQGCDHRFSVKSQD